MKVQFSFDVEFPANATVTPEQCDSFGKVIEAEVAKMYSILSGAETAVPVTKVSYCIRSTPPAA